MYIIHTGSLSPERQLPLGVGLVPQQQGQVLLHLADKDTARAMGGVLPLWHNGTAHVKPSTTVRSWDRGR